jgi:HEAT repeat protein
MSSTAPGSQASDFVRALALAWKNLAAYPRGHPALAGALEQAQLRLDELRGPAGDVIFGVASDGLVYGKEKIQSEHARKFAYALYTNRVSILRFDFGTDARELETFLQILGVSNAREALWDDLAAEGVSKIHLTPVDYSGVQITDTLDDVELPREKKSLWDEILGALLAGRELGGERVSAADSGIKSVDDLSALIAKTIDAASDEGAEFDPNATFGIKFIARVPQTADTQASIMTRVGGVIRLYLAGSTGTRRQLAVQQLAHLVGTLSEPMRGVVLRSALEALTADESAGGLVRDLTTSLARDEVLEALRQLDDRSFAGHAVALLGSLAAELPAANIAAGPVEIDRELITIFGEDDVDRFNPEDHQALLEQTSLRFPHITTMRSIADLGDLVETVTDDAVMRQLVDTAFELIWSRGPSDVLFERIESAFHSDIASGQFKEAHVIIDRLRELGDAGSPSLARLASPAIINELLAAVAREPERVGEMHSVIQALGMAASRAVLVALTEENNLSRRRRLFDFAVSLGPAIVPDMPEFLRDERWFVVRNMIMLLRAVNDRTLLAEIRRCAHNPDLRVRLEAIKTLLAFDTAVPSSLLERAINDPDPKLAETAISLVGSYGIKEGVDPLLKILAKRDVFAWRTQIRIRAIKALGELAQPEALERMKHLFVDTYMPWPALAERRAAYETLASYPPDARRPYVEKGLKSRDPIVRDICRRLAGK